MTKWIIKYSDAYGDLSSVMVEAETKEEATDKAYREYWDIEDILVVRNSIVIDTLFHLLRKMFCETENEQQQMTLF